MLRALIKKQIWEMYKGFFVSQKKGTARSVAGRIGYILLYFLLVVGVLGGAFFTLSMGMCAVMHGAGLDWLYFAIITLIALVLGVFTGAFTTYTIVYQAKDNDLLLSMPVPVHYVLLARLFSVYLQGLLFTAVTQVPAIIVYALQVRPGAGVILCAALQMLCISVLVLVLSCLLGWVVAKISLRLKNRNLVKVLASLLLMGAYYIFYFRAMSNFQAILQQAAAWGSSTGFRGPLYVLGSSATHLTALSALAAVAAAALFLTCRVMSHNFLALTAGSQTVARSRKAQNKEVRVGSLRSALLKKELARFTSNANYMLNCALGTVFLPALAVVVLLKRETLREVLGVLFTEHPDAAAVCLAAGITMVMSMNDLCSASVSLEGKSIWIPQSLPVTPWQVLRAKLSVQVLVTLPPAVLSAALCAAALDFPAAEAAAVVLLTGINAVLFAMADLALNIKLPNLTWTNELYPLKQSGCVAIALFVPWGYAAVMAAAFLLVAYPLGAGIYLGCFAAVSLLAAGLLRHWLQGRGGRIFAEL